MEVTDSMTPLIQAFTWVITALSLLLVNLRLYIKWKYRGTLWYDDYLLVASVVFLLANAGLIQRTAVLGYGQHVDQIAGDMTRRIRMIVVYLQVLSGLVRLSTSLARISFATTLLQLSDEREKHFVWFAIITLPAVAIPAVIFPFVSCIPYDKIFDPSVPGKCMDEGVSIGYFIFEAAYTSFIDFALVVVPWRILSKLQLRRVEKLGASLAMSLGILSGIVTIIKASYTSEITDPDFTYSSAGLAIWNMVEPASVIIAASLPNLRVFIVKNSENLKASLRIGSNSRLGSSGRSRRTDDVVLDNAQGTSRNSSIFYFYKMSTLTCSHPLLILFAFKNLFIEDGNLNTRIFTVNAMAAGATSRRREEDTVWSTPGKRDNNDGEKSTHPSGEIIQSRGSALAARYQ